MQSYGIIVLSGENLYKCMLAKSGWKVIMNSLMVERQDLN
jgi:hypothetical protein